MSTTTKERPILFSGPMVRAIQEDRKSQTRRFVKPQPDAEFDNDPPVFCNRNRVWLHPCAPSNVFDEPLSQWWRCPYGKPGDRLWVRERFSVSDDSRGISGKLNEFAPHGRVWYFADNDRPTWAECPWRPSIHMPRWASRITLEITGVRVERLNDISEADAIAEGIQRIAGRYTFNGGLHESRTAAESFRALWEQINGPGSWAANPLVWVIGFKRVEEASHEQA